MTFTVVLVDDVAEARHLVRTALRFRRGVRVTGEAETGAQAIEVAERLQPAVVVLDLGLPDLAGEEVLTRIHEVAPQAQIVVFTGRTLEDESAWFEDQAAALVSKDRLDRLVDVVDSLAKAALASRSLTVTLPRDPESPRHARARVRTALRQWGLDYLYETVALVVGELASNAVEHAESDFQLTVSQTEGHGSRIRVEVDDGGRGTPEIGAGDEGSERGRGLLIVSAISEAWGVTVEGDRKVVWAELDTGDGV